MIADTWFDTHQERLNNAVRAIRSREAFAAFGESPSRKHHPEGAKQAGLARFESMLGRAFDLDQRGSVGQVGRETSPYTREPLGITYPAVDPERAVQQAREAMGDLVRLTPRQRVGLGLEILSRLEADLFAATFATRHTTGQGFMMAFAGSGANSLDRGLEGLAMAHIAMDFVPARSVFERSFGRGTPVRLDKRFVLRPRGVATVLSCGTYPAWNAYPAVFANLATANPVILKPHPNAILPMAMAVAHGRAVLEEAGLNPNALILAADERENPITKPLLMHPDVRIVDFTGGQAFGDWIVENCRHAAVYTETSGCNSVLIESVHDVDAVVRSVATSVGLFSAQMCTAAQNIYLPASGVRTPDGLIPYEEMVERFVGAVDRQVSDGAHAAGLCGALFDESVSGMLSDLEGTAEPHQIARRSSSFDDPEFPNARNATPMLLRADAANRAHLQREYFGPVAFLIRAESPDAGLAAATADAAEFGAIASYAYAVEPDRQDAMEEAFFDAGSSVGINLLRQQPINFSGAYSDFHVTGLNPAGTATLTDLAFVADRFRVVQSKRES